MPQPLPDLGLPALALVAVAFLIAVRESKSRKALPGRQFLLAGCGLLLAGSTLSVLTTVDLLRPLLGAVEPIILTTVAELVGYVGGFICLGVGLLQIGSGGSQKRRDHDFASAYTQLQSTRALLRCILEGSLNGIIVAEAVRDDTRSIVDFEFRIVNKAAQELLGRDADQMIGQRALAVVPCVRDTSLFGDLVSVVETGLPIDDHRYRQFTSSSDWYVVVASKLGDGVALTVADVTKRKLAEDHLRHAAHHDTLTGLPNRSHFAERLEQAIVKARNQENHRFAVLFLDFDRFKIINDSLGHDVGDELLRSIARRLRTNLAGITGTAAFPARIGGDEFIVLLEGPIGLLDPMAVADLLQLELSKPHLIASHEVVSTASIGIVTSDGGFESPEMIIRLADAAMYQSKQAGKARNTLFDSRMHDEVRAKQHLERDLREAVKEPPFQLAFEPIVALDGPTVVGCEALIRWPHPVRGVLFPGEFLEVAEDAGIILPIGRWVLENALRQLKAWRTHHPEATRNFRVNVNLARAQLGDPETVPFLTSLIDDIGLDAQSIVVEITESMFTRNAEHLADQLTRLRDNGIRVAMDDFGVGTSSLDKVRHLPLDTLKLDRSIVTGARKHRDLAAVIHAMTELAHELDLSVIAEGVETPEQLALVQALGCRLVQGHVFGRPTGTETIDRMLAGEPWELDRSGGLDPSQSEAA